MQNQHKGLRAFVVVFTVTAWGALALSLIGAVSIVIGGGGPQTPPAVGLVVLAAGGLYFCLLQALSGIIRLLLTIEEQTRKPL